MPLRQRQEVQEVPRLTAPELKAPPERSARAPPPHCPRPPRASARPRPRAVRPIPRSATLEPTRIGDTAPAAVRAIGRRIRRPARRDPPAPTHPWTSIGTPPEDVRMARYLLGDGTIVADDDDAIAEADERVTHV